MIYKLSPSSPLCVAINNNKLVEVNVEKNLCFTGKSLSISAVASKICLRSPFHIYHL